MLMLMLMLMLMQRGVPRAHLRLLEVETEGGSG